MDHRLKSFFKTIDTAIIICDLEGIISLANTSTEDVFCESPDDLLGKNIGNLKHNILTGNGDHFDLQKQVLDIVIATNNPVNTEFVIKCSTDIDKPYFCSAHPLKNPEGELTNIILMIAQDEYKFPVLFNSANLLTALIDTNGYIIYANDWLYAVTGWTQEEVIGKNFYSQFLARDSLWRMTQAYIKADNQRRNTITFEGDLLTKYGERLNVSYSNLFLRDFDGEVNSIAIIGKDVTHVGFASAAHYKSEDYFRDIFGQSSRAVFICSSDGKIRLRNTAFAELTGFSTRQGSRNPLKKMLPLKKDETTVIEMIKDTEKGNTSNTELEMHRKDETIIHVLLTTSPVNIAGKNLCLGYVQDITEQKNIERERLNNLHFFGSMDRINRAMQGKKSLKQMMSDVLDEVLHIFNCDRVCLVYPCDPDASSWSAPMERTKPEWPGALTLGLVVPMDQGVAGIFRVSRDADGPVGFGPGYKEQLPTEIAAEFNIQSQMTRVLYPKVGSPWNFVMHQCSNPRVWTPEEEKLLQEISRRIEDGLTSLLIYRDLQKSEQKYREIFEESLDGLFVTSPEGNILDVNKRAVEIFGYDTREEVLHLNMIQDVYANPEDRKRVLEEVNKNGSGEFDIAANKKSGEEMIAHASMVGARDENGNITSYRGIVRDVTEQRRAAKEIRESRKQVLDILESITDVFFALDDSWRFTYVNHRAEELFGIKRENLLFRNIWQTLLQDEAPVIYERFHSARKQMKPLVFEEFVPRLGKWLDVHTYSYENGLSVYLSDITERKRVDNIRKRLTRELQAISSCNQAMTRASDEQTLLNEICNIVCDEAGYRLAWVGYALDDDNKNIRPTAWAGFGSDYIKGAKLSWSEETERGNGPAGVAVRSGNAVYVQDFIDDPLMAPWRNNALQHGYRSGIALPLKDENNKVFGVFLVYSAEPYTMNTNEIRLMEGLADDLAFGIVSLRARIESKQAELIVDQQINELERMNKITSNQEALIKELREEIDHLQKSQRKTAKP